MTKGSLLIDGVFCKLSQEGMCMDSATLERIQNIANGRAPKMVSKSPSRIESMQRLTGIEFLRANVRYSGVMRKRYMVRVIRKSVLLYADIITGTLFHSDGVCLTSYFIRMVGNPETCKKPEVKKFIASRKSLYDGDE